MARIAGPTQNCFDPHSIIGVGDAANARIRRIDQATSGALFKRSI